MLLQDDQFQYHFFDFADLEHLHQISKLERPDCILIDAQLLNLLEGVGGLAFCATVILADEYELVVNTQPLLAKSHALVSKAGVTSGSLIASVNAAIENFGLRRQADANSDAWFLCQLRTSVSPHATSDEIMQQTISEAAARLRVDHVGFCSVNASYGQLIFHNHHCKRGSSLAGTYELESFGEPFIQTMENGHPLAISDIGYSQTTLGEYHDFFAQAHVQSLLVIPIIQLGRWIASFWAAHFEPREWLASEIDLMRTAAERMWMIIETAKLQAATSQLNSILEGHVTECTRQLHESQEQLRQLTVHTEKMREEERIRIAREAHDQLGGALTVLKMSLLQARKDRTDDADLMRRIQDMREQLDNLVHMVRRIASDLRPPLLDDFGLFAAVDWEAQEWSKRTGIEADVTVPEDEMHIEDHRRTAVFRVFQESLTNVARHSQASSVTISIRIDDGVLILTVGDNGVGIPAEKLRPGKSLGLLGMRERIREAGGDLTIAGAADQGTTVTVTLKLEG